MKSFEMLVDEHAVARTLGLTVRGVQYRRYSGLPPRPLKIGSLIRYKPKDVERIAKARQDETRAITEAKAARLRAELARLESRRGAR